MTSTAAVSLVFMILAVIPAAAQTGAITGIVYRDTANHPLAGVQVTIDGANRTTQTTSAGAFLISGLPAARYVIELRHVGFAPLVDTVVIAAGFPVNREYVMAQQAVTLGSVQTTEAKDRHVTQYDEFLDRLEHHNGGHFVDAAVLRKNASRRIGDLLTSLIPGLRLYQPLAGQQPSWEYVSSGRGQCKGPAFTCGGSTPCPVALYVDGLPIFSPGPSASDTRMVPDFSTYNTSDYAGIEYYAGGGSVPERYNSTNNSCGVLLLWTRKAVSPR
jgi:hypothetical protein